nr:hypothetical protein [Tanacetum cinerariifolium]
MSELLKIKNRELELKAAELEIRCMENRQRDEALYETTTDEALKERLRQRLFGKDYAQNVKNQSKTGQYRTQDLKSTAKAESTGIFL